MSIYAGGKRPHHLFRAVPQLSAHAPSCSSMAAIDPNMTSRLLQIGSTAFLNAYFDHGSYTVVKTGQ